MPVRFVDTNVLLYAISRDPQETSKADRANAILRERDLGLSAQVLQEFHVQATRASRPDPLSAAQAKGLVESCCRFPVAPVTADLVLAAIATHTRFRIAYRDAAIIEAARTLRCDVVLSEDLADGQDFDGVRVENPFRAL